MAGRSCSQTLENRLEHGRIGIARNPHQRVTNDHFNPAFIRWTLRFRCLAVQDDRQHLRGLPRLSSRPGAQLAPPAEHHIGVKPMLHRHVGHRRARLTGGGNDLPLELDGIIWPALAVAGLNVALQSSSH